MKARNWPRQSVSSIYAGKRKGSGKDKNRCKESNYGTYYGTGTRNGRMEMELHSESGSGSRT